jgi:hypothetical protein
VNGYNVIKKVKNMMEKRYKGTKHKVMEVRDIMIKRNLG